MSITAQEVNKLRQMTGAGMMDCKKALTEAGGNFEEAIVILRKKGQKISANRADKEATEGAVFALTNADETKAALIALNCETDFVAKNEEFQSLGKKILDLFAAHDFASKEDLYQASIEGKTVEEHLTELVGKIGEKIEVKAMEKVSGDKVVTYIHSNGKLGVLLSMAGANSAAVVETGKDIAMQIAAMNPLGIDKDDVDPQVIEREIEIGKDQARQEGKPEAMLEKIALGKLNKFYQENTLVNQQFVKDNSKTIRQLLEGIDKNLKVTAFKRITVG